MRLETLLRAVPLLLFAGLVVLMAGHLGAPQQQVIRSHMIGKPLADFTLDGIAGADGIARRDFTGGGPVLVNIFASWCLPCAVEAPQLVALGRKGVRIYGIALRDTPANIQAFLGRNGNPYRRIGLDPGGRSMLDFGASGVPETFVVDGRGVIRYQHMGEIRPEHVAGLLAELDKAR